LWETEISGSVPPTGRSGGILLGVDSDLHEVLETECGTHFVRMLLKDKISRIEWHLVVVYGPAQIEGKDEFPAEFAQPCDKCKGQSVIGGDFNIIRKTSEKTNPVFYQDGVIFSIPLLKLMD
jgi:hypothetical protein